MTGHKLGTFGILEHKKKTPKVICDLRSHYQCTVDYIRVRMLMYGLYVAVEHWMVTGLKDVHIEACKVQNILAYTH